MSRSIRAICAGLVDALPIPDPPFTLEGLVERLGQRRAKRIELVPVRLTATVPCGVLAKTDDVDLICYPANTSTLHRWHIVLHELGHLELGHHGRRVTLSPDDDDVLRVLQKYMPDLSTTLIRQLLSRTSYEAKDEQYAEQFATLAGRRLHRLITLPHRSVPQDMTMDRLRTLFDVPPRGDGRG